LTGPAGRHPGWRDREQPLPDSPAELPWKRVEDVRPLAMMAVVTGDAKVAAQAAREHLAGQ
jgi:hypothetical protein